ncbi:DUF1269 domain-containing protein [Pseudonocardia sp. T1-2H]|uniref:DUF1269 domain-containing protein n=1 Tax=Pseudonocardia sp. T1-2H TaxID=3128899 RepID=UPI00310155E4
MQVDGPASRQKCISGSRGPSPDTGGQVQNARPVVRRSPEKRESLMASATDAPVDLYIAAYGDPDAARGDWDAIKQLAADDVIAVDGLILVSRRSDGKIHVDDDFHTARKGAAWGAVGGAVVGLIFPPSLLAGALVGAGVGGGVGGLMSHAEKKAIKAEVEDTLPLNSSGIVAMFEEQWATAVDDALPHATNVTKEQVDPNSANQVKAAATDTPPATT